MNRHAGASFALSVLLVCFFGIVLYQPEPRDSSPPQRTASTGSSTPRVQTSRVTPPPPTPGIPLVETQNDDPEPPKERKTPRPQSIAQTAPNPAPLSPLAPTLVHFSSNSDRDLSPKRKPTPSPKSSQARLSSYPNGLQTVSTRHSAPPRPRSAFTQVAEGESLTDIALRVYGDSESVHSLWLANRDTLPNQDSPLRSGTLLRTPDQ